MVLVDSYTVARRIPAPSCTHSLNNFQVPSDQKWRVVTALTWVLEYWWTVLVGYAICTTLGYVITNKTHNFSLMNWCNNIVFDMFRTANWTSSRWLVEASWNVIAHAQKPDYVFRAKRTRPFKSAGASVQSTTGSRGVCISGSNVG